MEPIGAVTKGNVGSGGGPWCVAAQSWAADAPQSSRTWAGAERRRFFSLRC